MADTGRTDPFENMISLAATPIAAVIRSFDQMRRGADEVMKGLENFNATMENLNQTAARVNRLLNDFEEPLRAMLPQMTRTVKLAEDLSNRLAGPVDQVAPGLSRLADMLNSPIVSSVPRDLGQFMEVINDLGRRMTPLAQLAEQASAMFGMRIPGLPSRPGTSAPAPQGLSARQRAADPEPEAPARAAAPPRTGKRTAAKKATARSSTTARKTPARKRAAAKRSVS